MLLLITLTDLTSSHETLKQTALLFNIIFRDCALM